MPTDLTSKSKPLIKSGLLIPCLPYRLLHFSSLGSRIQIIISHLLFKPQTPFSLLHYADNLAYFTMKTGSIKREHLLQTLSTYLQVHLTLLYFLLLHSLQFMFLSKANSTSAVDSIFSLATGEQCSYLQFPTPSCIIKCSHFIGSFTRIYKHAKIPLVLKGKKKKNPMIPHLPATTTFFLLLQQNPKKCL